MPQARCFSLAFLALAAASGCANLEARKVPLPDRLAGTDARYKGFRYYLSRPYIVVSRRVCVGQQLIAGKLMQNKANEFFIETISESGARRYLDMRGEDSSAALVADESLVYVTYQGQVSPPPGQSPAGPGEAPGATLPMGGGSVKIPPFPGTKPGPGAGKDADSPTPVSPEQFRQILADQLRRDAPPAPPPAPAPKPADTTPPAFQFVMLPDFEEQMAIKDCNFAARGKYELRFGDGWQLRTVGGSWDATQVAVRALQVLGDAVSATAAVRQEQLNKLPVVKKRGDLADQARGAQVLVVRVQGTYVEPGVYRLLKSAEKQAPPEGSEGANGAAAGVLADLGLPTVTDVQTYLLAP
jgi:hypothetical protein